MGWITVSSRFKLIPIRFGSVRFGSSPLRRFVPGLCGFMMVLFPSVASASHYEVTYQGGISYFKPNAPYAPYQTPYSLNGSKQWVGRGLLVGSKGNPPGPPTEGAVSCSGAIIATLTWTLDPGEQQLATPPSTIIVKQNISVSFSADAGNWDDGIGQSGGSPNNSGITTSNYVVISNPGNQVVMNGVNPTVQAQGNSDPPSDSVSFSDNVIVPQIVLSGTTAFSGDPLPHILVGQQLSAQVNLGLTPDPNTPSTYGWACSGGHPFARYSTGTEGTVQPWTPPNASNTSFYFAGETSGSSATESVQCTVSATVAGQVLSIPLSASVTLDPPAMSMACQTGSVLLLPDGAPTALVLAGRTDGYAGNGICGIVFPSSVTTPSQYGSGGGVFFFAQLIDPNRVETFQDGSHYSPPVNGQWGLDNAYPYPFDPPGTFAANGQTINAQDEPWVTLTRTNNGSPENGATASDSAKMYLMYRPPGAHVCDVPLAYVAWGWGGTATLTNGTWVLSSPSVQGNASVPTCFHPTWMQVNSNSGS